MLESLDVFRIARHLGLETSEVFEKYAEMCMITMGTPILLLKTKGTNKSCIFLHSGKCSIEPVKPRACKLYPLSVGPDDDLVNRLILKTPERQFHYIGKAHRAGDWVDANMNAEATAYVQMECRTFSEFGKILGFIPQERENDVLTQMLLFRFFMFDTSLNKNRPLISGKSQAAVLPSTISLAALSAKRPLIRTGTLFLICPVKTFASGR